MRRRTPIVLVLAFAACGGAPRATPPGPSLAPPPAADRPPVPPPSPRANRYDRVERAAFNRSAEHLDLPLTWSYDKNNDGAVDPDETAVLLFHPGSFTAKWVDGGSFTPSFEDAYK